MPAVAMSEFMRFGVIGIIATALYGALATVLTEWDWAGIEATSASVVAYLVAAIFSYLSHKSITFLSTRSHRVEGPRFVALTLAGLAVAFLAPVMLTDILGLQPIFAILFTCVVVPMMNFVVMDRWVFAHRRRDQSGNA